MIHPEVVTKCECDIFVPNKCLCYVKMPLFFFILLITEERIAQCAQMGTDLQYFKHEKTHVFDTRI